MLILTLDPSLLTGKTNPNECVLTVTIAGCTWEGLTVPLPSFNSKFEMMDYFYPFCWKNRPKFIKVLWLNDNYEYLGCDDFKIDVNTFDDFDSDRTDIREHYEAILNDKIVDSELTQPIKLHDAEIVVADSSSSPNSERHIEFSVLGDDDLSDPPVPDGQPTHFLTSSIAQFAQKLVPNNLGLNLAFISRGAAPPEDAHHCIAVPIGPEESVANWVRNVHILDGAIDLECSSLPSTTDPAAPKVTILPEAFYLEYKGAAGETLLKVYSRITPLPKTENDNPFIDLRDEKGNFLGQTRIQVSDSENLLDGEEFKKRIIRSTSRIFNLPALVWEYFSKNADLITTFYAGATADEKDALHLQLNQLLTSLLRDCYCLGNDFVRKVAEPILNDIVVQYNARVQGSGDHIELEAAPVLKKFVQRDPATLNSVWRTILAKEPALLQALEKIDNPKPSDGAYSVDGWLALWKPLVTGLPFDVETGDPLEQAKKNILGNHITHILDADYFGANDGRTPNSIEALGQVVAKYFENYDPDTQFVEAVAFWIGGNTGKSQFQVKDRDPEETVKSVTATLRNCLGEYVTFRSATHTPSKVDRVFPSIATEVGAIDTCLFSAQNESFWDLVIKFVENFDFAVGDAIKFDVKGAIETVLRDVTDRKTYDIPPNLVIRVDDVKSTDDLSDEISGNLLFVQRSKTMHTKEFEGVPWNALNLSRINLIDKKKMTATGPTEKELKGQYLIPSFLPSLDENLRTAFLSLSNERLSLVAGHDVFIDREEKADYDSLFYLKYLFSNASGRVPAAYALWYGFNYNFANFIALNSGVLAGAIADSNLVELEVNEALMAGVHQARHKHLRRVPFSKVHMEVFREKSQKVYPIPIGLNTIASEMLEHPDKVAKSSDEPPVYLLFDDPKGMVQNSMRIELGKPQTSFWNWYAWMGKELATDNSTKAELDEALKAEMSTRNEPKASTSFLHDPALENELWVQVEEIFPNPRTVKEFSVKLEESEKKKVLSTIKNGSIQVMLDHEAKEIRVVGNVIKAPPGVTLKINVRCLTRKQHFEEGGNNRFHHWMKEVMGLSEVGSPAHSLHYATRPHEIIFEAAIKPDKLLKSLQVWKSLQPFETDKGEVALDVTPTDPAFAYFSRITVDHQVWHWNGRLTADLLKEADESERRNFPQSLDPVEGGKTNYAMNWEAWEFSDRPDSSALSHETNLKAKIKGGSQTVFTDSRPVDEKARYYRFSTEMFGRYELLGGVYAGSVKSALTMSDPDRRVENPWKRFFRPSRRVDELPKPVIRFVIPLTESIEECHAADETRSASLMIVLNDRWFSETGLAETCEVGIEILGVAPEQFLNAGPDPILSGKGLNKVDMNAMTRGFYVERPQAIDANPLISANPLAVFRPEGPAGLTFDLAASTPKLVATTFILKANDINQLLGAYDVDKTGMSAWSMAQIAVRRNVERTLWENTEFYRNVREFRMLPKDRVDAEKKRFGEDYFEGEDDQSKFGQHLQTLWDLSQAEDEAGYEEYQAALKEIGNLYTASDHARTVEDGKLAQIKSKWSAKEWVQFLPDTASLIPKKWRSELTQKGAISFTPRLDEEKRLFLDAADEIRFPSFSPSDKTYLENAQRYLVLSETTTNAGGQPVERYRGTFKHHELKSLILNDSIGKNDKFEEFEEGYARLLLVRTRAEQEDNGNLWEMLFGANKVRSAGFTDVQADPHAALPLISKRFPIRLNKKA